MFWAKIRLELMSFKNWAALLGAIIVALGVVQHGITVGQGFTLFTVITAVYLGAKAYVDASGNGTMAMAARKSQKA